MTNPKQTFLHSEIWLLTFGGAFQRTNIYKLNVPEVKRKAFRVALKAFVMEHILPQYKGKVVEMAHVLNIEAVRVTSEK